MAIQNNNHDDVDWEQSLDLLFRFADRTLGLCLVSPDGTVLRVNTEWQRSTGYAFPDAVGANIITLFPQTRDLALALHARARAGEQVTVPRHTQVLNGRETWWEGSIHPVAMPSGTGLLIVAREVGGNRSSDDADAALIRSERRLALAQEASGLGIYDYDVRSGRISWDARVRKIWEVGPTEDITIETFFNRLHPDDVASTQRAIERAFDPNGDGRYYAEYRVVSPSTGEIRWVIATGQTYFEGGEPLRLIGTVQDATQAKRTEGALRESEERFRIMADGLPLIVWVHDARGEQQFVNQTFCEYFGVTREEMRAGRWKLLTHPDDGQGYIEAFVHAVHTQSRFHAEVRVQRADGIWRWIESFGRPRFSSDGAFLGHVGTSVDVTERKAAEAALRESDRRKGEFLAVLAHEMRNPLGPLMNGIALIDKVSPGNALTEVSAMMQRQVKHLQRLIDDVFDVSRIGRGILQVNRQVLLITEVIQHALELSGPALARRRVDVALATDGVQVDGDPERLAQVFSNLLNNAGKFTPPGGTIRVTSYVADAQVVVEVIDDGVGIPPDKLESIFDLYMQAEVSYREGRGGLGIGLSLVRQLVELHGGSVSAESDGPGHGARFTVSLPRVT